MGSKVERIAWLLQAAQEASTKTTRERINRELKRRGWYSVAFLEAVRDGRVPGLETLRDRTHEQLAKPYREELARRGQSALKKNGEPA